MMTQLTPDPSSVATWTMPEGVSQEGTALVKTDSSGQTISQSSANGS